MKDLLTYIAQNLVEHPQAVDVQETETDGTVVLELRVDPSDMGKVIGLMGDWLDRKVRFVSVLSEKDGADGGHA